MFRALRSLRSGVLRSAAWRPSNARMLAAQVWHRGRNAHAGYTDDDHLRAAADWLRRAQDVTGDGGVSGRYLLRDGWTSSYPETTGYLIPTFIALAKERGADEFMDRARRCVDFLQGVRLDTGAFPGGEIAENRTQPSVFNSAQIINGLVAWHEATGEQRAIDMAVDAGHWLVSQLDADGAWRKHVYRDTPVAYAAHASCWLAQLGVHSGDARFTDAAVRNLEWVLSLQDPETGWFDRAGWDERDVQARIAETHTIAYTIWGVLYTALAAGHAAGLAGARRAAVNIARRLELSRRLAGKLDSSWKARANYQCLTGNAQMALIWMRLDEHEPDPTLVNTALKAIDLVSATQSMDNPNPGIRGGIAGSDPVWGDYIRYALPNWAAKFYIDALLEKKKALARLRARVPADAAWRPPPAIRRVPDDDARRADPPVRVVMLTRADSQKVPQMLSAWSGSGFRPAAVVIVAERTTPFPQRVLSRLREAGLRRFVVGAARARLPRRSGAQAPHEPAAGTQASVRDYCAQHGIPVIQVSSLTDDASLAALRALRPDLAIHAGCGILRPAVLAIPRLGTINAHMGLLPRYRGMNVAEWAFLLGGPVGCSVHFIDAGIDTGRVIAVREVDTAAARSVRELRALVDHAQIDLLGQVVSSVMASGSIPHGHEQRVEDGEQFFRLHPAIADVLESDLRDRQRDRPIAAS